MKYRLRKVARVVLAAAITVVVAGAAAAVAIYLTGPSGLISCVPAAAPAKEPIPRWVIAAGIPALVAALMGAFFALAPERYANRHEEVVAGIETVKKLWRGEAISVRAGDGSEIQVRTYPTPVQREVGVWVTAAGNPRTF